jgi:hypothetical protein
MSVPADPTKKYYTIVAALNSLFSRGTIVRVQNSVWNRTAILLFPQHVTSSDPKVQAKMDPHYFEQEFGRWTLTTTSRQKLTRSADLKQLVDVVKFCRKIPSTAPLKDCFGTSTIDASSAKPTFTS